MDSKAYEAEVVAATLAQIAARELHDRDFAAFGKWKGAPVKCILDVGANRGQSVASLHAVFPAATIHSFEANPIFFPVLERVAEAVGDRCRVHRFGLGAGDGEFTLHVPWVGEMPFLEESSTVLDYYEKPWVAQKFAERGGLRLQQLTVAIRRGVDLGLAPQVVKIDVEGAENDVVEGLAATIRRSRPILLVENSDWHTVTASLAVHGYNPYRYEPDLGTIVPFHGATTNAFYLLYEHLRGFCSNVSLASTPM
jgi:FkbM family methyltransferase